MFCCIGQSRRLSGRNWTPRRVDCEDAERDRIHLQDGVVYRNGERLEEPYVIRQGTYNAYRDNFPNVPVDDYGNVTPEWRLTLPSHIENGDLVVPPGSLFAMGDNRDN